MPSVDINWWAVLVAAGVNMVVGAVWYSKPLFAKQWSKLTGRKIEDMTGGGTGYGVAAVGALIMAWVLAHFEVYAGSTTAIDGAVTAFWLWLAFVAVTSAVNSVFSGRSWQLWQIDAGYFLVVLLINGAILAVWQ